MDTSIRLSDNSTMLTRLVFMIGTMLMLARVWAVLPYRIESAVFALVLIAPTTLLWSDDPARVRGAMMSLALLYATISVALRLVVC